MSQEYPRLRGIEAFPLEQNGQTFIALRDPSGYAPSVILLPAALVDIVARFDGEHSVVDIQAALIKQHGEMVFRHRIDELIEMLDEQGFLDSPSFVRRRAEMDGAFLTSPTRPASHAGGAYAAEAPALRQAMDGFFVSPAGPGALPGNGASTDAQPVRGIIAPHIDFHRGGPAYAWAYRDLAERCSADLFVVFGTCHAGMRDPFALTLKDFETPFGPARVDRDFVEAVAKRSGQDYFGCEVAHRTEHSIEFQAVFLQYLYAGRRDITIVPVLASFAHEALGRRQGAEADARVPRFLEAIAETADAGGRRVAYVAGADLAHVGPRFGDRQPISPASLAQVSQEDRAMLDPVNGGDARAFFESVAADGDRRRICGLSPIYSLLRVLEGGRGDLRHYGQWLDPQAVVTYASVTFA